MPLPGPCAYTARRQNCWAPGHCRDGLRLSGVPIMDKVSPRVRKLDKALSSLPVDSDAMLVSELDGLVAGLLVCPELILPGEWLPLVWGGTGEAGAIFDRSNTLREDRTQ